MEANNVILLISSILGSLGISQFIQFLLNRKKNEAEVKQLHVSAEVEASRLALEYAKVVKDDMDGLRAELCQLRIEHDVLQGEHLILENNYDILLTNYNVLLARIGDG